MNLIDLSRSNLSSDCQGSVPLKHVTDKVSKKQHHHSGDYNYNDNDDEESGASGGILHRSGSDPIVKPNTSGADSGKLVKIASVSSSDTKNNPPNDFNNENVTTASHTDFMPNQLFFINNSFNNSKPVKGGVSKPANTRLANGAANINNLSNIKPFLVNNPAKAAAAGVNHASNPTENTTPTTSNNQQIIPSAAAQPNFDLSSTIATLPPIISGKKINLPLGPHRYL